MTLLYRCLLPRIDAKANRVYGMGICSGLTRAGSITPRTLPGVAEPFSITVLHLLRNEVFWAVGATTVDCGSAMPVQFTIDVARKLVISTYSGEISESDFFGVASRIKAHPDFDPRFSELVDFSGVTGGAIPTSALQAIARQESVYNPSSMHVVVVPQDHLFGLVRMYQVYAEETKPNVVAVRSMEEACEVLGLG